MQERNSKVIGISLPPEVHKKLNSLMKAKFKTRSELIREMIDTYSNSLSSVNKEVQQSNTPLVLEEADITKILKAYYELRSNQEVDTIVIGLGIIVKDGKVLIGKRGSLDKNVRNLTWVFPGGKLESLNFSKEIAARIKVETNLETKVGKLIHARIHPDNLNKKLNIVALYFHCEVVSGKEKPGGRESSVPLVELKWVKPADVVRYFTASTADEVMRFLVGLELTSA